MTDFAQAIPVLASLNLEETAAFYQTHLGCRMELFGDYAIARRDQIEIHFWLCTERHIAENTSCYIRGGQVPALFEEFSARGVPGLKGDLSPRPWGMREFYVIDPHGNLLKFGCSADEGTALA